MAGVFFLEFDGPRARTLWVTFIEASEKADKSYRLLAVGHG